MKCFKRYFISQLDGRGMALIIIVLTFTSALIDSAAFNSWSCFVHMQSGNTIFAALGITGQPEATHRQQYYKSLVSIGAYILGTVFFHCLHRYPDFSHSPTARRRIIFLVSFALQMALTVVAASLVTLGIVSNQPAIAGVFSSGSNTVTQPFTTSTNFADLAPIALLAFAAAGQVCFSRVLGVMDLPTTVLSTLYHDFTADLYGINAAWRKRESLSDFLFRGAKSQGKRLMAIVAYFLGGVVGGEMFKSPTGMAGALWMAAGLKLGICGAWLVWKGEANEVEDEEKSTPNR